jgi:MFS family permease
MVEPIKRDLSITDTQFSLITGLSFALFYSILGFPIGGLVDRMPRRLIASTGVIVWSVMTAACGLTSNFWQLFVARVGVGTGEASLSPAAYSLISDWFPPHRLGRAISTYLLGAAIGTGLAMIVGGSLIAAITAADPVVVPGIGALAPWQSVMVGVGLAGIPVAGLIWLVTEPTRRGRAYTTPPPWTVVFSFIVANGAFLAPFLMGTASVATTSLIVLTWAPSLFIRIHELNVGQVGYYLGVVTMISMAGGLFFGVFLSEKLSASGHSNAHLAAALFTFAASTPVGIAAALIPNRDLAIVLFGLFIFLYTSPIGLSGALIQIMTPNEMRGRMSALYLFVGNVSGMVLGPLLPALLTDYYFNDEMEIDKSMAVTIGVVGALGSVGFSAALLVRRKSRVDT